MMLSGDRAYVFTRPRRQSISLNRSHQSNCLYKAPTWSESSSGFSQPTPPPTNDFHGKLHSRSVKAKYTYWQFQRTNVFNIGKRSKAWVHLRVNDILTGLIKRMVMGVKMTTREDKLCNWWWRMWWSRRLQWLPFFSSLYRSFIRQKSQGKICYLLCRCIQAYTN